jgi:hypothetical protein
MSCGQHYRFYGFFRDLYISKDFLFVLKRQGKNCAMKGVLLLYIFTTSSLCFTERNCHWNSDFSRAKLLN